MALYVEGGQQATALAAHWTPPHAASIRCCCVSCAVCLRTSTMPSKTKHESSSAAQTDMYTWKMHALHRHREHNLTTQCIRYTSQSTLGKLKAIMKAWYTHGSTHIYSYGLMTTYLHLRSQLSAGSSNIHRAHCRLCCCGSSFCTMRTKARVNIDQAPPNCCGTWDTIQIEVPHMNRETRVK
jgi:hypothetical protein